MMAPPTPTTTPITVLRVFGLMLEEELLVSLSEAGLVDFAEEVDEEEV